LSILSIVFQVSASPLFVIHDGPMWRSYNSFICGATHVATWTPLVMWPIGTRCSSRFGQSDFHMLRDTTPCSAETPFAVRESFSASTVIVNASP